MTLLPLECLDAQRRLAEHLKYVAREVVSPVEFERESQAFQEERLRGRFLAAEISFRVANG